jgi:hypothetical protein
MAGAKHTWEECEMHMTFWLGNQTVRDHVEDQGMYKGMLKRILNKQGVVVETDSSHKVQVAAYREHSNDKFGLHKRSKTS